MRRSTLLAVLLTTVAVFTQSALAVPTFQVYVKGGVAQTMYGDEDTWFTTDKSFDLVVVGAYGPKTQNLTEVTLLLSVPKGQSGTISISGADGAKLLTIKTAVADGYYNPNADADTDLLINEAGNDGYYTKNFIPAGVNLNNHYPFKEGISSFILYGIGDFENLGPVNNYDADNGIIGVGDGKGEEKIFDVSVDGFSWVHFDAYGYNTELSNGNGNGNGKKVLKSTWEINPGSHDATYIPAPGAIVLSGIGAGLVGWLRRRRTL